MLLLKKILSTAIVAACFGLGQAGCTRDDDPAPSGRRNVTMQLTVNAQAVGETDGTPTAGESALHSLRVYAFVKGQPAGYYGVEGDLTAPATFLMDLTMYSETTQTVDFYVVANEEAMSTPGGTQGQLTPNTTEARLKEFSFTQLNTENGLPMSCRQQVEVNLAELAGDNPQEAPGHEGHTMIAQKVSFELKRPVGKLGVFAAKTAGETGTLQVTRLTLLKEGPRYMNYLMPQDEATLKEIGARDVDISLPVTDDEVTAELAADASPEERKDPANYTPVLGAPHYLFETPWGSPSWETPGDAGGNILRIDYAFDGAARSGLVYLPAIERNTYYTVCCRMNNSGKISVEYTVADWDDTDPWDDIEFNYPTYTNPVEPLEGHAMADPTVYYTTDENSSEGVFSCRFRMTAPSGQEWLPTLLDASPADFEVKVYQNGLPVERPVASANWYTITVRALKPDNVGRTVSLGVSYTPTWDPTQSKLLLINGTDSNHIAWPDSGNTPELIVIEQVDPTNI